MRSIWLHGASVGDMRSLHPIYRGLRQCQPQTAFWITAWTEHGRHLGQQIFDHASVTRPPLPWSPVCVRSLQHRQVQCAVFEYLELWPAWTKACEQFGIPMVIVDGRITQKTMRIAPILRRAASRIHAFCAQTDADAEAAVRLGIPPKRVHVMGNSKFDGFPDGPAQPTQNLQRAVGCRDVIVGSLHADEEVDFVRACIRSKVRILVAPRYLARVGPLYRALKRRGIDVGLRSRGAESARVAILDTIGELAAAYGLAPVAVIGGTFGRRQGQNLFEAALHNRLIFFGPNHRNVVLEVKCLSGHGAECVPTLDVAMRLIETSLPERTATTYDALLTLRGAAARQVRLIETLLDGARPNR
ncbi:MAG: glycosyltransferase N-terminal domain-containing protein [Myxococcota bacterium]|nr:glycosyltransferase N-terminal domain-containing protein [Myxococcota bacterium]